MCRRRDRTAFIKAQRDKKAFIQKHIDQKLKEHAVELMLNEAKAQAATMKLTIREAKKEIDSEVSDGGSTAATTPEETTSGAKLIEQIPTPSLPSDEPPSHLDIMVEDGDGSFSYEKHAVERLRRMPPPSLPNDEPASHFNIKIENDDGEFSYEKYEKDKLERSGKEAWQAAKKQKTDAAGLGGWTTVQWIHNDSRNNDYRKTISTTGSIDSNAHAKTESSEFTFRMPSGRHSIQ
jgi:hypothetical protein